MKTFSVKIPDVKVIVPEIFNDERGFFLESFNQKKFNKIVGKDIKFVQDNHSKSSQGVLRGLHYQVFPMEQAKLVRVISGEIFDVALDLRTDSAFYGKWVGEYLTSSNLKQLWIPEGFAHGFLTISEFAEVVYKTSNYYSPEFEKVIPFNDKRFNIDWPKLDQYILSDRDSFDNKVNLNK